MGKIDTDKWKDFELNELFTITGSSTTPKNALEFSEHGIYPYITTAATNNGIAGYSNIYTDEGNILTVDSAVVGKVFYQKDNFTASDHVEKLIPKFNMTKNIGTYLATILNRSRLTLDYAYNNKRSQKALKNEKIKLPVCTDGTPDWNYIEKYMQRIFEFTNKKIVTMKKIKSKKHVIDSSAWKKFKIGELFNTIRGRRFVVGKHIEGNIPYYSASLDNNGITDYISNPLFVCSDAVVVTTFGDAFYAKGEFTASDEITILKHELMNELSGLFIATVIQKNKWKYSFKVKAFSGRLKDDEIYLPVLEDGTPDWKYMEQYMLSILELNKRRYNSLSI